MRVVAMRHNGLAVTRLFPDQPHTVAYWQSRGWALVAGQPTVGTALATPIVHGAVAATARPDTPGPVLWIGSARPTYLDPARDVWVQTTQIDA